jgi:hypothetical protein
MTARYLTAARLRELDRQLVERDHAVLHQVSELRFVSGVQLTRLHFSGNGSQAADARAARRALLRLVHLNLLARLPRVVGGIRAGSAGFVYCLGPAGYALAVQRGWLPEGRRWRSQTPGTLFLHHALAVAELHVQLMEADRAQTIELLELRAEPACWRSYQGRGTPSTLKPDSFVRLGTGDFEFVYFIEIDRATEGSRAIAGKLRQYLDYEASGAERDERGVVPLTLWLAPDQARARVIEDCVQRLPSVSRELFRVALFSEAMTLLSAPETTGKSSMGPYSCKYNRRNRKEKKQCQKGGT